MAEATSIHQLMLILDAKLDNHLFISHNADGKAIMAAITTSFKKSLESSTTI